MTEPLLTVRDLSVSLQRNGPPSPVLDRVSFDIQAGEIVALVGESGSGKSTLGLALQGLLPTEARPTVMGSIRIDGAEMIGARPSALRAMRRSVARSIPQDPMSGLNPTMTIARQLEESAIGADIGAWLGRVGLNDPIRIANAYPHELSGGQRQRVLIAMAMLAQPKLLVADEPTTALDPITQAQILERLRTLAREAQAAILFITHDLAVAASLAERVIVLYAGRIVEIGRLRDVASRPAHPYTAGLLAARYDLATDRTRPLPTLMASRAGVPSAEAGCVYAPRCPLASPACSRDRPPLRPTTIHPGSVACFHSEQTQALAASQPAARWLAMVPAASNAIELRQVSKGFPGGRRGPWGRHRPRPVLRAIDLAVAQGECVAIVGESGVGKSTLLRLAAGLIEPDSGTIVRADGAPPQTVYQDATAALTPWLSIGEQIGERLRPLGLGTRERARRVMETMASLGLDAALLRALPRELSGGQCQRAAIARAIIVPPKLLLCDEPASALDVSVTAAMLNLLGDLRRRLDMSMLFVTHDFAAARIVADRIVVLEDGRIVEEGDADSLVDAPQSPATRTLVAAARGIAP